MINYTTKILILSLCFFININNCYATTNKQIHIVTSIKPFYNLVAAVTKDHCNIKLLVQGDNSHHSYAIKPSDLQMLSSADLIFWGGEEIEPFLKKVILKYKTKKVINISMLTNIEKKSIRTPCNLHKHTEQNNNSRYDPHIWLSINNAKVIIHNISVLLSKYDPNNKLLYKKNAADFLKELELLDKQLNYDLAKIQEKKYLVLHDAYQYFESQYSLQPSNIITIHPEIPPSAKHLQEIKKTITSKKLQCVFSEPQFQSPFINTIVSSTNIKHGILDPIGKDVDLGVDGYLILIKNLSENMLSCLK